MPIYSVSITERVVRERFAAVLAETPEAARELVDKAIREVNVERVDSRYIVDHALGGSSSGRLSFADGVDVDDVLVEGVIDPDWCLSAAAEFNLGDRSEVRGRERWLLDVRDQPHPVTPIADAAPDPRKAIPKLGMIVTVREPGLERFPHVLLPAGQRLAVVESFEDSIMALVLGDDDASVAARRQLSEWNGCVQWVEDIRPPDVKGDLFDWFWSDVDPTEQTLLDEPGVVVLIGRAALLRDQSKAEPAQG